MTPTRERRQARARSKPRTGTPTTPARREPGCRTLGRCNAGCVLCEQVFYRYFPCALERVILSADKKIDRDPTAWRRAGPGLTGSTYPEGRALCKGHLTNASPLYHRYPHTLQARNRRTACAPVSARPGRTNFSMSNPSAKELHSLMRGCQSMTRTVSKQSGRSR